jgi:NAD(P)-dependent dehydrogenase (short-subunit alcohol dehydrogenase family)
MVQLEGATVAITGGARGIGRATALEFAERGAQVVTGDLDRHDSPGLALELDVTKPRSWAKFAKAAGTIDVLVNNAGVMPSGRLLEQSSELLAAQMDINYWGTLHGLRAVLPGMVERGNGHVVNVASMAAKVAIAGLAPYCASKAAVVGLSASLREELPPGVTCTTVLPSAVRTRLSEGFPIGRLGVVEPDDVAKAIVASCRDAPAEMVVPGWTGLYEQVNALLPEPVMRLARRVLQADRVITARDDAVRSRYEREILPRGSRRGRSSAVKPQ